MRPWRFDPETSRFDAQAVGRDSWKTSFSNLHFSESNSWIAPDSVGVKQFL